MIADPVSLRSEPFVHLGGVIEHDVDLIMHRWQQCAVAEQPNAGRLHHADLLDDLPELLRGLAASLAAAGETNGHRPPAARHGRERWEDGWSIDEVVHDYQILRRVLLEHLDANLGRPLTLRESLAVGLSLDEAIADSVARYSRHREAEVRRQEQAEADRLRLHAAELAAAERHKDEFLAVLGHELRNPLAPVRNAVELLRQRPDAATAAWAGELMERQVRHFTRLVDDLLDTSRLARGKLDLRPAPLDLTAVVRSAVEDHRRLFEDAGRELVADLPPTPVPVRGDADRLDQVLDNLLANAHKFTRRGGRVAVALSTDTADRRAVLTVADNGCGIPADELPTVFQRYRQGKVDPERPNGGLGLGLALVKGLVELHDGSVAAASPGPGMGATFTVSLPLAAGGEVGDAGPGRGAGERKPKVLVVEDNRDGADSLCVLLRLFGFDVGVAYSGPDGLAAAQADPPDVLLCDLALPGMDGYAVAAALRAARSTAAIRLVAISGHGSDTERQRSLDAGFVRHILKPVEPEEVRALVTELARR